LPLSLSLSHTHTHSLTLTLTLSHNLSLSLSRHPRQHTRASLRGLPLSHTHIHTHTPSLSHSVTHSLSLALSVSTAAHSPPGPHSSPPGFGGHTLLSEALLFGGSSTVLGCDPRDWSPGTRNTKRPGSSLRKRAASRHPRPHTRASLRGLPLTLAHTLCHSFSLSLSLSHSLTLSLSHSLTLSLSASATTHSRVAARFASLSLALSLSR